MRLPGLHQKVSLGDRGCLGAPHSSENLIQLCSQMISRTVAYSKEGIHIDVNDCLGHVSLLFQVRELKRLRYDLLYKVTFISQDYRQAFQCFLDTGPVSNS